MKLKRKIKEDIATNVRKIEIHEKVKAKLEETIEHAPMVNDANLNKYKEFLTKAQGEYRNLENEMKKEFLFQGISAEFLGIPWNCRQDKIRGIHFGDP